MRKAIIIGESVFNINFPAHADEQIQAFPGGKLLDTASRLGVGGVPTTFVSEASRDRVGDLIVEYLQRHQVDTSCIDRFCDGGHTTTRLYFPADDEHKAQILRYEQAPTPKFDTSWPRIDPGDVVVFGTYFSLDKRVRPQLLDILNYARERKAIIVYVPGFHPNQESRITRVMPEILDNLEIADITLTRSCDLDYIFGARSAEDCFNNNIKFHCGFLANIDASTGRFEMYYRTYSAATEVAQAETSGVIASLVKAIMAEELTIEMLPELSKATFDSLIQRIK